MDIQNILIELIFKDNDSTIGSLINDDEIMQINIFDDLGYDSVRFIELIVDIENRFQIELDDELLVINNFSTISRIIEIISSVLSQYGDNQYA